MEPVPDGHSREVEALRERYARREDLSGPAWRYNPLNPSALQALQERQRAVARTIVDAGWRDVSSVRLLEVGCGTGGNLLEFLQLGFRPEHLSGIELLERRVEHARHVLPSTVQVVLGDAAGGTPMFPAASQDIVYQATVFSSILDDGVQQRLSAAMWRWVRPGGGVLWYDFTFNNPKNPDVRGVPVARLRQLFPGANLHVRRVTLAPPIARLVSNVHPGLYSAFNSCPWLRTHVLAWAHKPGTAAEAR